MTDRDDKKSPLRNGLGHARETYWDAAAKEALGSVVPVVGNAVGAVIGGLLGAFGGGFIGRKLGRSIFG